MLTNNKIYKYSERDEFVRQKTYKHHFSKIFEGL